MMLEHSIINQHRIHSFETDTFWFWNLLKQLLLYECLIYGNYCLAFYNNMGQKANLAYMWTSIHKNG